MALCLTFNKRKTEKVETVRAEEFYKYFKQQNEGFQNNCSEMEAPGKSKENETGPLDYLISDEEFDTAICKLKANKAPDIDNILKRSIKIREGFYKGTFENFIQSNPKHRQISSALEFWTDSASTQKRRPI